MHVWYIGIIRNQIPPGIEIPRKIREQKALFEKAQAAIARGETPDPNAPKTDPYRPFFVELAHVNDLSRCSTRWYQSNWAGLLSFGARTVGGSTKPGQRQDVEENVDTTPSMLHAYARSEGICAVIVTEKAYPTLVAHQFLSKVADEFLSLHAQSSFNSMLEPKANSYSFPALADHIKKYQDPGQADSVAKIQKELDETKIALHKTIESVVQRGEKLDDLVAKSNDLGIASKQFYKSSKDANRCCVVM